MSERGPVGGAGELTALAQEWRRRAKNLRVSAGMYALGSHSNFIYSIEATRLDGCADELEATRAAKAPQEGVPTGQSAKADAFLHTPAITSGAELREKITIALWETRSPEALRDWDNEKSWIKDYHYKQADAVLAALAAPSAPSLPVPGPVSDNTIHHGMFPPATSTARTVSSGMARDLDEAAAPKPAPGKRCIHCHHEEQYHHSEDEHSSCCLKNVDGRPCMCPGWPTPAPGAERAAQCPTCTSPAPHLHPAVQHEGEVQPCSDTFHKQATSQNKLMGATPAPGAERLRERIAKAIWEAENAEEVRRNPRYPNTGEYAQWPEDAAQQPYCQSTYRIADAVLREVLAAAPPVPSEHPQLGTHLQHCNFGEHENACKYGDADCPALSEGWSWFGKALQRADATQWYDTARQLAKERERANKQLLELAQILRFEEGDEEGQWFIPAEPQPLGPFFSILEAAQAFMNFMDDTDKELRDRHASAERVREALVQLEAKSFPMTPHDEAEPCVTLADVRAVFGEAKVRP